MMTNNTNIFLETIADMHKTAPSNPEYEQYSHDLYAVFSTDAGRRVIDRLLDESRLLHRTVSAECEGRKDVMRSVLQAVALHHDDFAGKLMNDLTKRTFKHGR